MEKKEKKSMKFNSKVTAEQATRLLAEFVMKLGDLSVCTLDNGTALKAVGVYADKTFEDARIIGDVQHCINEILWYVRTQNGFSKFDDDCYCMED